MAPILGIYASQISGHLFTQGTFDSIATTTVGAGGAASITFSSIPQTYTHLQIRGIIKNTSTTNFAAMQFNSDTGNNYSAHYLDGDGATAISGGAANYDKCYFSYGGTSANANVFGVAVIDILDYANTNKFKTVRGLTGVDVNGVGGYVELNSSSWRSTSAITNINILFGANNFAQYSQIALYGIKAV